MQKYQTIDHIELPDALHTSWQNSLNILAEAIQVPAALIMRVHSKEIEVFVRSQTSGNVYEPGEKADLDTGLYCETVMDTGKELLIPNALIDPEWDHNPDIELGMISYCGLPISWPPGEIFGTICVLDIKENKYSKLHRNLLEQFRNTVQAGLAEVYDHYLLKKAHEELQAAQKDLKQEVKEHKEAEQDLEATRDQFEKIVEGAADAIISVGADQNIIAFNKSAQTIFGYAKDDALGEPLDLLLPKDAVKNHAKFIEQFRHSKPKTKWMGERKKLYGRRKNGELFPAEASISKQDTSSGVIFTAILKDVSKRIIAEDELRRHRDHLEELVAERTAEVNEKTSQLETALESEKKFSALQQKFISLVSHEFRTPLTIIDGAAQRLARIKTNLTPEVVQEKAGKIRAAVGRMTDLIENTLYAANLEEGAIEMRLEPMDLGGMLRNLVALHGEVSPDHDFAIDVGSLAQSITADEKLLNIVFSNLLSNAIKFAPPTSSIEVKGWTESNHAVVSVADHGVGIPERELPHMFERFFRARTAEGIKGTGIGLNVSKEFVEMHGGTIEVASVEGEGSTFTVRLPADVKGQ